MKRASSTAVKVSSAMLANRYLALRELREKVRKAEERFESTRLKKGSVVPSASTSGAFTRPTDRKP